MGGWSAMWRLFLSALNGISSSTSGTKLSCRLTIKKRPFAVTKRNVCSLLSPRAQHHRKREERLLFYRNFISLENWPSVFSFFFYARLFVKCSWTHAFSLRTAKEENFHDARRGYNRFEINSSGTCRTTQTNKMSMYLLVSTVRVNFT